MTEVHAAVGGPVPAQAGPDHDRPDGHDGEARVRELLGRMTIEEKIAQLVGFWEKEDGEAVAPLQGEFGDAVKLEDFSRHGLGHLTRAYGTRPVDVAARASWLWKFQRDLVTGTRLGIPAIVHEECLTGLSAWKAATFPTPLAWGAAFDPELVTEMAAAIGASMRALGIHQGLSPVLDVIRDPRWGRVDECISEDPYLVGTVGTSYVRGLQSQGVHATLKHFAGYSASRAGRNFGPVHAGPRELADVLLIPFEMAILDGDARCVMHSYAEVDGVPVAADPTMLTGVLRDRWGFDGTVVADYYGVAFLNLLHHVAADHAEAAGQALTAGVDVELPTGDAYLTLRDTVRAGKLDEALIDRAVLRVLRQKRDLGLLDATFTDEPPQEVDLDSPEHRSIARRLAEESIVLVANRDALPLAAGRRVAVIGPNADRQGALFGCYSFLNHVLVQHPGVEAGIEVPTVLDALRVEFGADLVTSARGCDVDTDDRSGFAEAVATAAAAEVAVLVVGDHAGLFGRGTVGEGCDRDDLELPGVQRELVEAVLATGTPVVLVLVTGRPYAVGWALARCAAVVQAFFPGEEGAGAIAGVLSGRVNPSGRLPVTLPGPAGAQPYSYLHPTLGAGSEVTNLPATPVAPFGHGLSYTTFAYADLTVPATVPTDGALRVTVRVTNTGAVAGDDVVQLYGRDPVASVTRPVAQLLGYRRVHLEPGRSVTVELTVPTTRLAFSDRTLTRVVEPGDVELWVGTSARRDTQAVTTLVGDTVPVTNASPRWTTTEIR
ncbi:MULTISPECIES: glycoside hydrolase family 3 N-terminal domain-containing protein [Micromonospora]|uniref:Glycosyl hydrolase n=1 Tax=Micromonospora solifontis TaxID=2487138 RepID=A0ABX9WHV9_9ACTN|nr:MULTISPECIES: glycoside hydrolase family 3 N-terminal domain-containing protein [Micromonospora]NES13822.1 glycosyl hydrolase [Micromonospora sp. PPF5-17B]NES37086.1 glycosyl hydrolase [Micromonospora solifontis]NES58347.1 glycosyl hydrolase [Micromonospora sp. PPF5-6]RNL98755.1 glycosyl hydrolase [Micromonospora solifontis]